MKLQYVIVVHSYQNHHDEKEKTDCFHIDNNYRDSITSIYYINTNDGYTEFEDGTKVESIENRLITFPTTTYHCGTTCTNQSLRILINFNYF